MLIYCCVCEQAVYQDEESVDEPKFKISWSKVHKRFRARAVSVEKEYSYMMAMVEDVLSSDSNRCTDVTVNPTHIMAPQERPSRSEIIDQTQQFTCFK